MVIAIAKNIQRCRVADTMVLIMAMVVTEDTLLMSWGKVLLMLCLLVSTKMGVTRLVTLREAFELRLGFLKESLHRECADLI